MKTAIGGTLLFQLMMLFVVIYMGLMAMGINYAITFRVKNQLINILEDNYNYENAAPKIEEYLTNISYYGGSRKVSISQGDGARCLNGTTNYCIEMKKPTTGGHYYVITTYVTLNFPMIGEIANLPVKGETMIMGRLENL